MIDMGGRYWLRMTGHHPRPVEYRVCVDVQVDDGRVDHPLAHYQLWVGITLLEMDWWSEVRRLDPVAWLDRAPVLYPHLTADRGQVCWCDQGPGWSLRFPLSAKSLRRLAVELRENCGHLCAHNPLGVIGIREGEWLDLRRVPGGQAYVQSSSVGAWLRPESRWTPRPLGLHLCARQLDLTCLPATCAHLSLDVGRLHGRWATATPSLNLWGAALCPVLPWSVASLSGTVALRLTGVSGLALPDQWWPGLRHLELAVEDVVQYTVLLARLHPECALDSLTIKIPDRHRGLLTVPEGVYRVITDTAALHLGPDVLAVTYHCRTTLREVPRTVRRVELPARWCGHLRPRAGLDVCLVTSPDHDRQFCDPLMTALGYRLVLEEPELLTYRYLEGGSGSEEF